MHDRITCLINDIMTLILLQASLLLLLVALSAFFSGSETALFSLSRARLLSYRDDPSPVRKAIVKLLDSYHLTLNALILGNMFVNIGISMLNTELMSKIPLSPVIVTTISIIVSIIILLLLGEITPKTLALLYCEKFSDRAAFPILWFRKAVMPLLVAADKFFAFVLDHLGRRKHQPLETEEYASFLDLSTADGAFSNNEANLLRNAFALSQRSVSEIMRPRIELLTLSRELSSGEAAQVLHEGNCQYVPLIKEDFEDCEFVVSVRDFFNRPSEQRQLDSEKIGFTAHFIPENASLIQALRQLGTYNVPAALVVDEFGRTSGMINIKDIYSELVGDIEFEHETPEIEVRQLSPGSWRISGTLQLKVFSEITGAIAPADMEIDTVNGMFCELLGRLPLLGDEIELDGFLLRADSITHHRVNRFFVKALSQPEIAAEEEA
jgi:magnesium and cobalt exporter, CNNM family